MPWRIASFVLVAICVPLSIRSELYHQHGVKGLDQGLFLFGLTLPLLACWISEPEPLPPEYIDRLPRSRLARLLIAPCLPGGGRAALLIGLELAVLCAACVAGRSLAARSGEPLWGYEGWVKTGMVACYLATWLLLPGALLSPWLSRQRRQRALHLLAIPAFALALPWLLQLSGLPEYTGRIFGHFPKVRRDGFVPLQYRPAYYAMLATGLLSVALNLPRMLRGVREVLDAPRPAD